MGVGGITYAGGNVSVTTSEEQAERSGTGRLISPSICRKRLQLPPKT